MSDTDYTATNGEGATIDLRDLTSDELAAYRVEAAHAGDTVCVATIDRILADR